MARKQLLRRCTVHGDKLVAGVKCFLCNRARVANWKIQHPRRYQRARDKLNRLDYWRERYKNPETAARIRIKMRGGIGDGSPPREGVCPICNEKKLLVFDHCHKEKEFRGWICNVCNVALGLLKDSPANLERAIRYIEEHLNRRQQSCESRTPCVTGRDRRLN